DQPARDRLLGPEMCLALDLAARNQLTRTLRQTQALSDREQVVGPDLQTVATHTLLGLVGEIAEAFLQQWASPLLRHSNRSVEQPFKHSRTSERERGSERVRLWSEALMLRRKMQKCEVDRRKRTQDHITAKTTKDKLCGGPHNLSRVKCDVTRASTPPG